MKKAYVSPLANEVSVKTEALMDGSVQMYNSTVNTQVQGTQLGNTSRGNWGDLWAK